MLTPAKKILCISICSSLSLFAANYSTMSTEELMSLRGNVPVENIEEFGNVLSHRVSRMNDQELKKYGIWEMIKDKKGARGVSCDCTSLKKRPMREIK